MTPVFTTSIVTFRTPLPVLQAALESLRQCALPHEVLIVDNTPEPEYFAALQALNLAPCLHAERNGGYGYGHNLALAHMPAAPYHLVMNPDVVVHPGCIETLISHMEKTPEIGLAVPKVLFPDGTLQPLNKHEPSVCDLFLRRFLPKSWQKLPAIQRRLDSFCMLDAGYDHSCEVPNASGCFLLLRQELLRTLGGFDERFFLYFEDTDLTRRLRQHARAVYFPDASITHAWARGSHSSFMLTFVTLVSAFRYFQKWGWRWW